MLRLIEHLPWAITVGLCSVLLTGEPINLFVALACGWLIDIDHLVDLGVWIARRRQVPSLQLVVSGGYFQDNGKVIVPLHSIEIVTALAGASMFFDGDIGALAATAAFAMGGHILQDHLTYRPQRGAYFLLNRARHGFREDYFCGEQTPCDGD